MADPFPFHDLKLLTRRDCWLFSCRIYRMMSLWISLYPLHRIPSHPIASHRHRHRHRHRIHLISVHFQDAFRAGLKIRWIVPT